MMFKKIIYCFCVFVFCFSARCQAEGSQADVHFFDLPEQTLTQGVIEFALQAGVAVVADNALLQPYRTTPIIGPFEQARALSLILAKAPLHFSYDAKRRVYTILPDRVSDAFIDAPSAALKQGGTLAPPLESVLVSAVRYPFRYQSIVNTQLRGGLSVFDSTRFHHHLGRRLIDDVMAEDLVGLLAYASGVTPGDGFSNSNDDFYLRGFSRHALHVDGNKLTNDTAIKLDPENIDHVTILKGPSTLLFGQAEPGGMVDVVRKKPLKQKHVKAGILVGGFKKQKLNVDINLPAGVAWPLKGELNTRFIAIENKQGEEETVNDLTRQTLSPSVRWIVSDKTVVNASVEYQNIQQVFNRQHPLFANTPLPVTGRTLAQSVNYAHPDFEANATIVSASVESLLFDDWRLGGRYLWQEESRYGVRGSGQALRNPYVLRPAHLLADDDELITIAGQITLPLLRRGDNVELGSFLRLHDEQEHETGINLAWSLDGRFYLGAVAHNLALGADFYRQDTYSFYAIEKLDNANADVVHQDELPNTLKEQVEEYLVPGGSRGLIRYYEQRIVDDDAGVYARLHSQWNADWATTFGVRYSYLAGELSDYDAGFIRSSASTGDASVQLGGVWHPGADASIFFNYSQSVEANYSLISSGADAQNVEKAAQAELGVKWLGLNGRLVGSFAGFNIQKNNILDDDSDIYSQTVTGLEGDISYQLSDRTQIMATSSLIDPRIRSGQYRGNNSEMVADQVGSFFVNHTAGAIGVNLGVQYVGERSVDIQNTLKLGSYYTVDAGLNYSFKCFGGRWQWHVLAKNLVDKQYQRAAVLGSHINYAQGRRFQLRLGVDW